MIDNTNSSIVYVSDGDTNTWSIPFVFKNPDIVHAIVKDSEGYHDIQSNYEINVKDNKLIYPTTESQLPFIENGANIYIFRLTDITQLETSSVRPFTDKDIERALDKLTVICQDLNRELKNTVKYSQFDAGERLTADELLAKIKEYSESADDSMQKAENAKSAAILAKEQASVIKNETQELKLETEHFAEEASVSQTAAYNSKVEAKASEDNARAVLAETKQTIEKAVEEVVKEFKDKLEIPGYSSEFFQVGTEKGLYTGSLRKFPLEKSFVSNSTYIVVNGVWQQRGVEYEEDVDRQGITFAYDLNIGDVVWVLTAAGFFEKKDIETFVEAINNHNTDTNSHSDLREAIRNAGYEDNSVIELGEFGLKENKIGNREIIFDKEPKYVYIRFSDRNRAMWINGTKSIAGIKHNYDNSYSIFYNISSEDFKEQNLLLEPFVVQYVIKYMGEEYAKKSELTAERQEREEANLELHNSLSLEVEERTNADNALQATFNEELEQEVTNRNNAINTVIEEEVETRYNADLSLQQAITTETTLRTSSDNSLQELIDKLDAKIASVKSFIPVGSLNFGPVSEMSGYLLCNGQAVSREEYADLYIAIGTNFGAGDGSTTFNVPDYRGCFLRGLGNGSAENVYTKQAASTSAASDHFHIFGSNSGNNNGSFVASNQNITANQPDIIEGSGSRGWNGSGGGGSYAGNSDTFTGNMITTMGISASPKGDTTTESRPVNFAVNYFIKY